MCPVSVSSSSSSSKPTTIENTEEKNNFEQEQKSSCNELDDSQIDPQGEEKESSATNNNLHSVVAKAKRAAATLWMLLHAQTCLASETECPHRGCHETKSLLLHMKTCTPGIDMSCPEGYHGCKDARKLLAHYTKCSRQRKQYRIRQQQQHYCLICALIPRHDRLVRERSESLGVTPPWSPSTSNSEISMPPPPPRPRTSSVDSLSTLHSSLSSQSRRVLPHPNVYKPKYRKVSTFNVNARPRAESLDERNRFRFSANDLNLDPTIEISLTTTKSQGSEDVQMEADDWSGVDAIRNLRLASSISRHRSMSLETLSLAASSYCETIAEEPSPQNV